MDRNVVGDVMGKALAESLSARRAWIEILSALAVWPGLLSLSARRAWIEIPPRKDFSCLPMSLSARRAWIEIFAVGR